MTIADSVQPESSPSSLCFLGTYNNYSVLPHWPHGQESEPAGLYVCSWCPDAGKLKVLHKEKVLNPAFMK